MNKQKAAQHYAEQARQAESTIVAERRAHAEAVLRESIEQREVYCEWFARCEMDAEGLMLHPILGPVPCCTRCARQVGAEGALERIPAVV